MPFLPLSLKGIFAPGAANPPKGEVILNHILIQDLTAFEGKRLRHNALSSGFDFGKRVFFLIVTFYRYDRL